MDTFTGTGRPKSKLKSPGTEPVPTPGHRQMRSSQMMDEYESRSRDFGYDYTAPEKESSCLLYFKKIMFLIQIALIIGAAILFGGAFTAEKNGFEYSETLRFGEMDPDVLYVPYAGAAMSGVTAIVGCIGIKTHRTAILVAYAVSLALSLALAATAFTQVKADDFNVKNYASTQWALMTYEQEQIYQHNHLCCNFDSIDPCCRWAVGEGECENEWMCFDRVKPHLQAQFKLIGNCAILHTAICALVMALVVGVIIFFQITTFLNEHDGDLNLSTSTATKLKVFAKSPSSGGTKALNKKKGKQDHIVQEFDLEDDDFFR